MRLITPLLCLLVSCPVCAQWDPPAGFYDSATGTGNALKDQLESIMTVGHIQRRYGDFRDSAAIHDQDPNNPNNIILVYDENSVTGTWDSGSTWNREHVWPQSRQPGSASNSTRGNLGDPHALKPATPSVNSQRGNDPFGFENTVGEFGAVGSHWYPGDNCTGDIARSLFYSATRWSSLGLTLTDSFPSGNQVGELQSLIAWNFLDPPDEFERRRNHTIFSQDFNPNYYTNNRNAFIDRPEFVWSAFVDQQNDSMITIEGGTLDADSESVLVLNFGRVIVGTPVDTNQSVSLVKEGLDGTYYEIVTTGQAECELEGRYNAFRTSMTDLRDINVSLNFDPNVPGVKDGMVVFDNLDVTTQGGDGRGANDVDDYIGLVLEVVEHSNPSFVSTEDQNVLAIDLGALVQNEPMEPVAFEIHNLASASGAELTADADLQSATEFPGDSFLGLSAESFLGLEAGQMETLSIVGTPTQLVGPSTTSFVLLVSDESIPGAGGQNLVVNLTYSVVSGFVLGDVNCDGVVDLLDVAPFVDSILSGVFQEKADMNQDGVVDLIDVDPFVTAVTGG